ncbi:hypothetical protein ACTXJ1_16030 [Brachybacterium alimentarium]|uniref:hypothetical protein n=1 Tax=Brachybacterium alimentarium TaxID=47845 RepID=UPI003FD68FE7
MAITVGKQNILSARKLHLMTDGAAWKQFVTRAILPTSDRDIMYPAILASTRSNVEATANRSSIEPLELGITD